MGSAPVGYEEGQVRVLGTWLKLREAQATVGMKAMKAARTLERD